MPRKGPRTPEQKARENAQARERRAGGYRRPPRSEAELDASRIRARVRQRRLLGWSEEKLAAPPLVRTPARPRPGPLPPIPSSPAGHPLYDAARDLLRGYERAELGSALDTIAADLLAEYALAELEGRSGAEAIVAYRRRRAKDRATLVYGLRRVDDLVR